MNKWFILICMGILVLGTSCTASNQELPPSNVSSSALEPETDSTQIPASLAETVRQELSRQSGIAMENIEITEAIPQTWSDGCLGLAQADEACIQMLTEGWRIVLSNGETNWVYRSDNQGVNLRLELQE